MLKPEAFRRLDELFQQALDLPVADRVEFVERVTIGILEEEQAEEVRSRLAAMLRAQVEDVPPLEEVVAGAAALLEAPTRGGRLGPYRLLRTLGEGGMGIVFLAERADEEYRQRVAVKVLRLGAAGGSVVTRFRRERQILAGLEHPNIARLLDGGSTPGGLPYLVMEYVEGVALDDFCDRQRLSLEGRIRLFLTVCEAVARAHQELVVHRDLKPGNILVATDGTVKLLDFGIAKLLGGEGGLAPEATGTVERALTPGYASPEQVRGDLITPASDVYALGVILYRLLSGVHPYVLEGVGPVEGMRRILEEEPLPPSRRLSEEATARVLAEARRLSPGALQRRLRGDLDGIVLKALAKDRRQRYATAEALARDLEAYLVGQPVVARRPTLTYRAGKFLRRNRVPVAVVAAFLILMVAAGWTLLEQSATSRRQRDKAERVAGVLVDLFEISDPGRSRGEQVTAREILDRGARRVRQELRDEPEVRAMLLDTIGRVYRQLGLYGEAQPLVEEALKERRELLGESHPEVAASLVNLGQLASAQGRYEEAEGLLRDALGRYRRLPGSKSLESLEAVEALADLLMQRGRLQEAEPLLRDSLEVARTLAQRRFSHERAAALAVQSSRLERRLARVLEDQGDPVAAEKILRHALERQRELLGEPHREVATSLNDLAFLRAAQGDFSGAEPLYRKALEMRREVLGEDHPDLYVSLANRAANLAQLGRYKEAAAPSREALELARKSLGSEHPEVIPSLNNLAVILFQQGDYDAAEPLYREALKIAESSGTGDDPQVETANANLGNLLLARGDASAAEPLYRKVLESRLRTLGEDHPRVAASLGDLAHLYWVQGSLERAEELLRRSLEMETRRLGAEHPRTLSRRSSLGALLEERDRLQEAGSILEAVERTQRRVLGVAHPNLAMTLQRRAQVLCRDGAADMAEDLLDEALSIFRQHLSPDHWRFASGSSLRGEILARQGRPVEAEPLLRSSLERLSTLRGPDHRSARRARARLEAFLEGG